MPSSPDEGRPLAEASSAFVLEPSLPIEERIMVRPFDSRLALPLLLLAAASSLSAQTTSIFPTDHGAIEGPSSAGLPFGDGIARRQFVYLAGFVGVPHGAQITRIGFRPDALATDTGRRVQFQIQMGHGTQTLFTVSSLFAQNYSSAPTVVFARRIVQLPNLVAAPPGPSNDKVWIQLDTPFTYDASQNLVVDFSISAIDNGNQAFPYRMDLPTWVADRSSFGTGCVQSDGRTPEITTQNGYVAGPWTVTLSRALPNSVYSLHVGAGTSSWLGIPLPFPLDNLGAPGCSLLVEFPVVISRPTGSSGVDTLSANIPNDTVFYGLRFYAQALIFDLFANNLGVVTSNGASTTIGALPQVVMVEAPGNANATAGGANYYRAPVTFFEHF
jgi:hypothetical protein